MPKQNPSQPEKSHNSSKKSILRKPFWKFILIFEILLLVVAVGYIGFKSYEDGEFKLSINSQSDVSETFETGDSILVLLDTYKKPDDKYTIYRVQFDGGGEKEIWSHTFFNDYQFCPLSFPSISNSRNHILYEEENNFLIINSVTGKERKIPKHNPEFFGDFNCIWNNADTHIACVVRENKPTDFDQLLIVVSVNSGDEIIVNDSRKDKLIFGKNSPVRVLGWDKNDKKVYLSSTRSDKTNLLSVDIDTKKVTSFEVGERNTVRFDTAKYSAKLNMFVLDADRESILYTFDPTKNKKEVLYEYKGEFIEGEAYLSEDGEVVLFKQNDFQIGLGQSSDPKDGEPTSKIVKINLRTGKKQEVDYPFDPNDMEKTGSLSRLSFYDINSNNVIINNSIFSGVGLDDLKLEKGLYSYNLDSKKLTKIFSRGSDDFPEEDFQYDVIP